MPCREESGALRCDRLSGLYRHLRMRDVLLGRMSSELHLPVSGLTAPALMAGPVAMLSALGHGHDILVSGGQISVGGV